MRIVGHLPTPAIAPDGTLSNSEAMAAAIGFCIEHGTEVVVLHPPKLDAALLTDHHGRLRTGSPAVERMVDHFTAMVARMEAAGITVAVENNSSKSSTTRFGSLPAHIVALNNLLAVRGLHPGFCFDIGHAKASVANAQIAEWMGALGHSLAALHLHTGNPHTRITHSPIEELYGRTQWYGVAAWLALLQVEVPCLLEVRTPEDALRSARMLRRLVEER
jgi:sugar phosphate isomerase/epimerase